MKINVYYDLWKFPQTRYFEKMPTTGNEIMLSIDLKLPEDQLLKILLKHRNKEKYISLEEGRIRDQHRNLIRVDWTQRFDFLSIRSRIEMISEYLPEENNYKRGYLYSQLFKYKIEDFACTAQIASYDADLLMYLYEYDVDGALDNSVLKGNDIYYDLLFSIKPVSSIKLQFKTSGLLKNKDKMDMVFQIITSL